MEIVQRVKVILGAAVTWLTAAGLILTIFAEEIASVAPAGAAEDVTVWLVRIVAWIGAAVTIIRRVTPVLPEERGVLPVSGE